MEKRVKRIEGEMLQKNRKDDALVTVKNGCKLDCKREGKAQTSEKDTGGVRCYNYTGQTNCYTAKIEEEQCFIKCAIVLPRSESITK